MNSAWPLDVTSIRRRLARDASEPLWRSAYSLMLNVAFTSVSGFAFWIAAARLFPSSVVGRDSALVAAMITLSTVCQLNLGSSILRFLPVVKIDPGRAVIGSYVLAGGLTAIVAAGFVAVAPDITHNYRFLQADPGLAAVYVAAAAAWTVFALQDAVLTALHRAPWVPAENGVFGVLKIAALPALLAAGWSHAVFVAWVIPMVLLLIPVNYYIFRRVLPNRPIRSTEPSPVERFGWRGLTRFMGQDYLGAIFAQASGTLLPLIIVALLGTSANAYFYIPFTIVLAFDTVFFNVTLSLTVEGAVSGRRLPALVRAVVRRLRYFLAAGVLLLIAGASLILLPFGPSYVDAGAPVLRLLACASGFRMVEALYSAICRVEGRASRILAIQAAVFVMVIGSAIPLAESYGINGVAAAWLIGNAVAGCCVAPYVARVFRAS